MISIIICSRTQKISDNLSENIKKTIGCEYELIVIDNSQNQYSIFEAYNLGIERSTNEYLCFIHDDILFLTIGWGGIINSIFRENNQIGLIGVAGAKIKTKFPSAWWDCQKDQEVICIIQHYTDKEKERMMSGFDNDALVEVVAIDGVFMAMRKKENILFDTSMKGFHNYDLNISFEYKKRGFKIYVINQIILEHFSIGNINRDWVKSAYKLHKNYKDSLPLKIQHDAIRKRDEVVNATRFIELCLEFEEYNIAYSIWWKLFCLDPYSKYHIGFWKRIIKDKLC
jgi:hypothetical protein